MLRFAAVEVGWRTKAEPAALAAWRGPWAAALAWAKDAGDAVRTHVEGVLARIEAPRAPLAGLAMDRPRLAGIVNATPDSFSDGGQFRGAAAAVEYGMRLVSEGAAIVDVGGESTRPGSGGIGVEEERARVTPVVAALAKQGVLVSIDTRKAAVMAEALESGARIVNDTSALAADARSLPLVAAQGVPAILMHMRGAPADMAARARYDSAAHDVFDELEARVRACESAGIPRGRLVVDPGIGFAKDGAHNAHVLAHLALYHGLGCALMLGVSRKRLVPAVEASAPPPGRLPASLGVAWSALEKGVQILRVHDVAAHAQMLAAWHALARPEEV
ncbi:MAG: dihydropteroate synthase [Alphaproteobacteria bacterium]|nr:dihydropteroate synthase [Alphaproteobacteria bacterium]